MAGGARKAGAKDKVYAKHASMQKKLRVTDHFDVELGSLIPKRRQINSEIGGLSLLAALIYE